MDTSVYLRGGRRNSAPTVREVIPQTSTAALASDALQNFIYQAQRPQQSQQAQQQAQQQAMARRMSEQQALRTQALQQQQQDQRRQYEAALSQWQASQARREAADSRPRDALGESLTDADMAANSGPVNPNVARAIGVGTNIGLASLGPIGAAIGMIGRNLNNTPAGTMGNLAQTGVSMGLSSLLGTDVNEVRGVLSMLGIGVDPVQLAAKPVGQAVTAALTPSETTTAGGTSGGFGTGSGLGSGLGYGGSGLGNELAAGAGINQQGDYLGLGGFGTADTGIGYNTEFGADWGRELGYVGERETGGQGGRDGGYGGTNNSAGGGENRGFSGGHLA